MKSQYRKVWTLFYQPMRLGLGNGCNQPYYTMVEVIETRKIRGFTFFSFRTPKGTLRVAEGQTGGIIADSFEEVMANIEESTNEQLQAQVDNARHLADDAKEKTPKEFFKEYDY